MITIALNLILNVTIIFFLIKKGLITSNISAVNIVLNFKDLAYKNNQFIPNVTLNWQKC